jgi:chaperone modulatory protein CbpM
MTQEQAQWHWLDTRETVTLTELSHCCGMSEPELDELVDYCALVPVTENLARIERVFSADCVEPLRHAAKLRLDFDLDLFTVAVLMENFSRIEVLERQVLSLQALLPPHANNQELSVRLTG